MAFNAQGPDELISGKPRRLEAEWRAALRARVEQGPLPAAHRVALAAG